MNNDKPFIYIMITAIIAITLTCCWQSYLSYLNRKLFIEAIKDKDPKYVNEQMQGLINDIKK